MAISKLLQDKLALLPDLPGCYIMKDVEDHILYVGKAKVLKNRVRSYFHGVHNNKTTKLVSHIHDFEFIVTGSEKEALLLEINLIKKHRPPFNIMFMDDKMYPYIEVSDGVDFTVRIARNVKNKKNKYFGPYPSSTSAYEIVKLINQIFPIRKCKTMPKQACLYYHMHQCLAPCILDVDVEKMKEIKGQVVRFLKGDVESVLRVLIDKRNVASENLQFERAQELQNLIVSVEHVSQKQTIDFQDRLSRDVFGYYEDKGYVCFYGFFLREGKILERTLSIAPIYEEVEEAFVSYLAQYYESNVVPREILVPQGMDVDTLEQLIATHVRIPERGEKKKLVDLANQNAKQAHEQKFQLVYKKDRELELANEKLSLIFSRPIHTVELFDNSHLQGSFNVSGLVVFKDGKPDKRSYRKYSLKDYRSDVDSMKEVVYRRYFRLLKEHKPMPDLLLVDGGRQQIAAAKEVKELLMLDLMIAGLVKDDKHTTRALMNEDFEEIALSKEESLFFLLTRMQDEVHRFAISYHRNSRAKGMVHSILDEVPGVGPVRKKELLRVFKSIKNMREASLQDLQGVVPDGVASLLYARLHEGDSSCIMDEKVDEDE